MLDRRNFLIGITTPAIVRISRIMPVSNIDDIIDPYIIVTRWMNTGMPFKSAYNNSEYFEKPLTNKFPYRAVSIHEKVAQLNTAYAKANFGERYCMMRTSELRSMVTSDVYL